MEYYTPKHPPAPLKGDGMCIVLKKVDSQKRVNNVQLTHRKAAQVLQ